MYEIELLLWKISGSTINAKVILICQISQQVLFRTKIHWHTSQNWLNMCLTNITITIRSYVKSDKAPWDECGNSQNVLFWWNKSHDSKGACLYLTGKWFYKHKKKVTLWSREIEYLVSMNSGKTFMPTWELSISKLVEIQQFKVRILKLKLNNFATNGVWSKRVSGCKMLFRVWKNIIIWCPNPKFINFDCSLLIFRQLKNDIFCLIINNNKSY